MPPTYQVMPFPRFFAVDTNGAPYAGGKLYAWQSGGLSVPITTYSDNIGTPNTNPVTLDSAGRAPVYLAPVAYAFELRDANGVQIWTQDPVYGFSLAQDYGLCGGRLTLTTGVPITTSDVTAAVTVFFTPYPGGQIALYDGTSVWGAFSFNELSIAVPAVANQMYDVFASQTAGVVSLSLTAWTNDTTRATAITLVNGVYVKSGATTNRFLGSFRTTTVAGQTEDSVAKRYLANWLNPELRPMRRLETTASWAYSTATVRQANGAAANQLDCVIPVPGRMIEAYLHVLSSNGNANISRAAGIGEDSTTTFMTTQLADSNATLPLDQFWKHTASIRHLPAVGRHFYTWLEISAATPTTTWYGLSAALGNANGQQSGMMGWMWG